MDQLVVFDFDGVIINSHDLQKKALSKVYDAMGSDSPPPFDTFFKKSGNSLPNIFASIGIPQQHVSLYRSYCTEHMKETAIHPGMKELLIRLSGQGYRCALCTGKERTRTLALLNYLEIRNYLEPVICSDEVTHPKPHPESLYVIKDITGIAPSCTVMVGDGINDIRCAKNAGIKSIAVTWGDCSADLLNEEHPTFMADTVEKLFYIITSHSLFERDGAI